MKLPQEMQRKITTYLPISTDFGADKHLQEVYRSRKKSLNMFKNCRLIFFKSFAKTTFIIFRSVVCAISAVFLVTVQ